jgi:hypothetical protein
VAITAYPPVRESRLFLAFLIAPTPLSGLAGFFLFAFSTLTISGVGGIVRDSFHVTRRGQAFPPPRTLSRGA